MPNTREKLIELVNAVLRCLPWGEITSNTAEDIADRLIEEGVTFVKDNNVPSKWISVKDRLPDRNDMIIAFYPTMRGTSGETQIHKAWAMSETCTHWMPLPMPPKGE